MNEFKDRLERIEVEEPVHVPTLDGTGVAETVLVKVPAWRDPKNGEIYLDTEATTILDRVKARHMGLLTPEQIKALRQRLGLTQKQVSELLQIGEKTWTRWETGRERPFRSINVLLCALNDGKIDLTYLFSLANRRNEWAHRVADLPVTAWNPWLDTVEEIWQHWNWDKRQVCGTSSAWRRAVIAAIAYHEPQKDFGFPVESKPVLHLRNPYITLKPEPCKESCTARGLVPTQPTPSRISSLDEFLAA
jgi:DNA-binding transcriptional regulator YiaG